MVAGMTAVAIMGEAGVTAEEIMEVVVADLEEVHVHVFSKVTTHVNKSCL